MSLISLLIALAAEKTLSSKLWQFNFYYARYASALNQAKLLSAFCKTPISIALFVLVPTLLTFALFYIIDEPILHFLFSTLILVVCFGCASARKSFKSYLTSAFEGDMVSCDLHEQELRAGRGCEKGDCGEPNEIATSFGQTLVWINYRYYFAVMLFFILFGAAGAVFYRLLVTVAEWRKVEGVQIPESSAIAANKALVVIDWLPIRIATLGYMFVGHFSKAIPIWVENLLDMDIRPQQMLAKVAKASEDYMLDDEDCTAEPCILVRLAKRNMLLFLALLSLMTISGAVA